MSKEKYDMLITEIKESRKVNDEQHERIFASAAKTEQLANDIQSVRTAFDGFKKIIALVKNVVMYAGIFYLVFKGPIHNMFGVG